MSRNFPVLDEQNKRPLPTALTAISLFSGIGGLDLAFALAGFVIRAQVEIDPFCRKVLEKHRDDYWPHATQHVDIRGVGRHNLPRVDVLFGGFPCQDISTAGRGAGIAEGTRSGLWFEFRRVISELRPRLVLLENVAAIIGNGGTIVTADLAEMGYDCRWGLISAADAGAPHKRERWFCVAYASSARGRLETHRRGGQGWQPACISQSAILRQTYWQTRAKRFAAGSYDVAHTHPAQRQRTPDALPARRHTAHAGSQAVAHAANTGLSERESLRKSAYAKKAKRGLVAQLKRPSAVGVAHSQYDDRRRLTSSQVSQHYTSQIRYGKHGVTQPRLGRAVLDGLPGWLERPQWAASPGQPQYDDEPPRTVQSMPDRVNRLKALGNAVVPAVVYPLAVAIRQLLEQP